MKLKERFLAIHDFLKPYQKIWQNEIMLLYPDPLNDYKSDWIDEIITFNDKETLIEFERKNFKGKLKNPELLSLFNTIEEFTTLPPPPKIDPVPETPFTWLFMTPKKQHEIKGLAPLVNKLYKENKINQIVDIGGGIGLLAQTINNSFGLKVTSVDMDPVLQETGRKRHEKNAKDHNNKVEYQNIKLSADNFEFQKILNSKTMTLGLHTCGHLALHQIKASAERKVPVIINFGCCYDKLDRFPNGENISDFAQNLPDKIQMSQYALTLACRAHKKMSEKDHDFKYKVKFYRYAIHALLYDHYEIKKIIVLGNSPLKLYHESFGVYVYEQLNRLNIRPKHSISELDQYFAHPERQELIKKMLAAGIIRDAFGRLLEFYILLDRAIYLEERGHKTEMIEFFDEKISPRNIGIVALR